MMKVQTLLSLFVIVTGANAQNPSDTIPAKSNAAEFKLNEISINTAPLLRTLFGANSSDFTRYSATYKRYLSCKSALRLSLVADKINASDYMTSKVTLVYDTLIEREDAFSPSYISPHINIGYERLFGKHKLKWFYGSDLLVGLAFSETATYRKRILIDTGDVISISAIGEHSPSEKIGGTRTKIFSVGLSPFFGAKFPLSKRFSISAQVGVDMTFQNRDVDVTTAGKRDKYRVSAFDFNQNGGILNDISLVYKF